MKKLKAAKSYPNLVGVLDTHLNKDEVDVKPEELWFY